MATGRVPTTANSPLTAKGDLFGYSTTQARVPVGSDGETLVADSSTTTGLRWIKTSPNYAINGAFDFWQRGTSFTVVNANAYTADRFYCYAAGANATAARSTSVPTGSIAPYSLEFTGAASQTLLEIGQRIESQYMNALKTTVTFSAKIYNETGAAFTPQIYIQTPTNADNWSALSTQVNGVSLQSCANGAWTTVYYTADWSGYSNISNGVTVVLEFGAAANGAAKKIRITEWQVTPTPLIIPFQRSAGTLAGELAACQRYYYRETADTTYAYFGFGMATLTTSAKISIPAPVTMRVVPTSIDSPTASTLRFTDGITGTACNASPTLDGDCTNEMLTFNVNVASGLTQYRPVWFGANNSSSAYIGFSAEL